MTPLAQEAPRRRRRRAWIVAAVVAAGLLAYGVAGDLVRGGSGELRQAELAAALEEVAAAQPAGAAGAASAARLRATGADLAAGRLSVTRRDRCAPGEIVRYGARDARGGLRVLLVRTRDGAEVHVYGEEGQEEAAAAVRDGQRADPRARSRADALAALAACGARP
jgi:hypothetical protein